MNNLLISYKWNDSSQSEASLIERIQALGQAIRIFESTWLVVTNLLPAEIMTQLKSEIINDFEIIICEAHHCAWMLSEPAQSELKKYHEQMYEF